MLDKFIPDPAVRSLIFTIALAGAIGAALGLAVTPIVPKKWSADAVILIGSNSGDGVRPSEPAVLLLERIRSASFIRAALTPKKLEHLVDALDSSIGGQMSAVVVRQAEAVRIQVSDRSPEVAALVVQAIFEAIQQEVDAPLRELRKVYETHQAAIEADAAKLEKDDRLSIIASDLEDLNRAHRSLDVQLANMRPTRMLSPVSVSSRPAFPKPSLFLLFGLIGGILVGYLLFVGRRLLRSDAVDHA